MQNKLFISSHLRWVPVKHEAQQASRTFFCEQHFLQENSTHLYSYLVYRFVLGQGQGARKEIDQNGLLVINLVVFLLLLAGTFDLWAQWGCVGWFLLANFRTISVHLYLFFVFHLNLRCKSCEFHETIFW